MKEISYIKKPFPKIRHATIDLLNAAKRKNMIHSMIEVDISRARESIRRAKRESKRYISFTGYIIHKVAEVVEKNKHIHAYRNWKNELIMFDDVDVSTTIERKIEGNSEVIAHIVRSANSKSAIEISEEILKEQEANPKDAKVYKAIRLYLAIPAYIRRLIFRLLDRSPKQMKKRAGTIMVTSANMVGKGAGWGIPIASHTLNLTIGGIVERPVEKNGGIEFREHLCLTVSFDHVIIDGAPAARFIRSLIRSIEEGI